MPCHWFSNFRYGLLGLRKKTIDVLDFGDGRYIEIGGGHVAQGHEPSRMCVVCALERIRIMRCAGRLSRRISYKHVRSQRRV
ncbi:hypothetical protein BDV29DRAFT_164786 [Aspergillus leporis]|uniref:Uncharacterized protein n=1 Tax=Aspergillus leporis TaxID=41062 RepID=A0A5N5XGH9_9EURO|nr:hypothetical protein BDV29DRAFT_164786 [Aspergillus leporis]